MGEKEEVSVEETSDGYSRHEPQMITPGAIIRDSLSPGEIIVG